MGGLSASKGGGKVVAMHVVFSAANLSEVR